jgi:hypothetical protein
VVTPGVARAPACSARSHRPWIGIQKIELDRLERTIQDE